MRGNYKKDWRYGAGQLTGSKLRKSLDESEAGAAAHAVLPFKMNGLVTRAEPYQNGRLRTLREPVLGVGGGLALICPAEPADDLCLRNQDLPVRIGTESYT